MPRGRKKQGEVLLRSKEFLGWALGGIEREISQTRERLAALSVQAAQLRARIGKGAGAAAGDVAQPAKRGRRRRRRMSAEARKRISEMMKKRWAERKKNAK